MVLTYQRNRWSRRARALLACVSAGLLLAASLPACPLSAQSEAHWELPATIGYGGLGCAAGYLLASEAAKAADWNEARTSSAGLGAIGGCWLGWRIGRATGREADALLADGQELPTGLRRGVQFGTVLTGATLATLVSFIHVSIQEGRDAEIITTYALAGAAVGAVVQLAMNKHLYPDKSPPTLQLGRGPAGGVAVGVVYRF
ncbi:MAG: hypothetical protein ABIF09_00900 [Gemmatimonadota bacterium]